MAPGHTVARQPQQIAHHARPIETSGGPTAIATADAPDDQQPRCIGQIVRAIRQAGR